MANLRYTKSQIDCFMKQTPLFIDESQLLESLNIFTRNLDENKLLNILGSLVG